MKESASQFGPHPSPLPRGEGGWLSIFSWSTSALLHLGVVLLALGMVWSVQRETGDNQWVIPEARLGGRTPAIPLKMERVGRTLPTGNATVTGGAGIEQHGTSTPNVVGTYGEGEGTSADSLFQNTGNTDANPFTAAPDSGAPFEVAFYGSGGNARDIVYVLDASGSLIDTFEFVLAELRRSINELSQEQRFTVVFFQGDKVFEPPPAGLRRATPRNKQDVLEWIKPEAGRVTPIGSSNPLHAIDRAMSYHPHLVYLLSDEITGRGVYELEQQTLLDAIHAANTHNTRINTIQFLYPDPLVAQGRKGTMELIAVTTGGRYRFVAARELGIE